MKTKLSAQLSRDVLRINEGMNKLINRGFQLNGQGASGAGYDTCWEHESLIEHALVASITTRNLAKEYGNF